MRILIAEDDRVQLHLLACMLAGTGHKVVTAQDGVEGAQLLRSGEPPAVAILDWLMPRKDGLTLCREIRSDPRMKHTHVIILTARTGEENVIAVFDAGADDYLAKPFHPNELRARIQVGLRLLELRRSLADRVAELEQALRHMKILEGLLPICSYCKRIRDSASRWQPLETFISDRTDAQFSHGICPQCWTKAEAGMMQELYRLSGKGQWEHGRKRDDDPAPENHRGIS